MPHGKLCRGAVRRRCNPGISSSTTRHSVRSLSASKGPGGALCINSFRNLNSIEVASRTFGQRPGSVRRLALRAGLLPGARSVTVGPNRRFQSLAPQAGTDHHRCTTRDNRLLHRRSTAKDFDVAALVVEGLPSNRPLASRLRVESAFTRVITSQGLNSDFPVSRVSNHSEDAPLLRE